MLERVQAPKRLEATKKRKKLCRYGDRCIRADCFFTHPRDKLLAPPKDQSETENGQTDDLLPNVLSATPQTSSQSTKMKCEFVDAQNNPSAGSNSKNEIATAKSAAATAAHVTTENKEEDTASSEAEAAGAKK